MLIGDFNARTGHLNDIEIEDKYSPENYDNMHSKEKKLLKYGAK